MGASKICVCATISESDRAPIPHSSSSSPPLLINFSGLEAKFYLRMTKVYPKALSLPKPSDGCTKAGADDSSSRVLTVWRKSLLFNCDGFTVFDSDGNLVYRVDNYMSGNKGEIFLMDASGTSLLTIRRKKLSLTDSWLVFDGETADNPRFVATKNVVNLLKSKSKRLLAHVTSPRKNTAVYEIEGSYSQRCCAVYDEKRRRVAEIKQKEASVKGVAFGTDIFRLVVQPGFDATVAMAIVILLDQMFGSSTSTRRRLLTN